MSASVMIAVRVAATPEQAFTIFVRDIALWWRPDPLFQITPKGDGGCSRLKRARAGG